MVANTGTYIDVPSHRFAEGADLAAAPVESMANLSGVKVTATEDPTRPAHTRLLAANVPIVEHLTGLSALPSSGFRFFALPPRIAGMGTFPVRAIALVG